MNAPAPDDQTHPSTRHLVTALSGLSPAQHHMLRVMSRLGHEATINDIAAHMGLHPNSARETIDALVKAELVSKRQLNPKGRGRPAWVYEPVVPESISRFHEHTADLMIATAYTLARLFDDPGSIAHEIGKKWAQQYFIREEIPDHSALKPVIAEDNIDIYVSKIRMFLSAQGFHARPGHDPHEIELHSCGYSHAPEDIAHVIATMHASMLTEVVATFTNNQLKVDLQPCRQQGICKVSISQN